MDKFYTPNTIAILFNEKLSDSEDLAIKIKNDISDDFEVFVQNTALALENGLPSNPDLLISIGGDGTILRCSKVLNGTNCPILGINMGNLGFLCELDSNEVIYYILKEFLYEGLEELLPDISGFSFNAECKKLEEKLF